MSSTFDENNHEEHFYANPHYSDTSDWQKRQEIVKENKKEEFLLNAIKYFNKKNERWEHYVDAGKFGVLHLYFYGHWKYKWIIPEKIEEK